MSGNPTRRKYLLTVGTASIAGLAGCFSSSSTNETATATNQETVTKTTTPSSQAQTDTPSTQTQTSSKPEISGARTLQYDTARTGFAPDESGPTADVTTQWKREFSANFVGVSPVVVDGSVYMVGAIPDTLFALDAREGKTRWQVDLVNGVTPAVMGSTVYTVSRRSLKAFSTADGSEQWQFSPKDGSVASPRNAPAVSDNTIYVRGYNNFYAVSAADGTKQWKAKINKLRLSPAVANGSIYVVGDGGDVGAGGNVVYALSAADGTEQWRFQVDAEITGPPTVVDDTVYIGDRKGIHALSTTKGSKQWTATINWNIPEASVAATSDTVYVPQYRSVNNSYESRLLALSAVDGNPRWSVTLPSLVYSSPVVVDNTVYVAAGNYVHAVATTDGSKRWQSDRIGYGTPPIVVDNMVYKGTKSGNVFALTES